MEAGLTNSPPLHSKKRLNSGTVIYLLLSLLFFSLCIIFLGSYHLETKGLTTNLLSINLEPSLSYPFGTDWLGRDMLTRTLIGLRTSIIVGFITSMLSMFIGTLFGVLSATLGRKVNAAVEWLVNLFLSLPSILLVIIITMMIESDLLGVIIGISVTHWAFFTRILQGNLQKTKEMKYLQISKKMGKSPMWIAIRHLLPIILPDILVGFTLTFSHAILYEANISFLGFGLPPHEPSIGIILAESMQYLSQGKWWLIIFPGLSLFIFVVLIHILGEKIKDGLNPYQRQSE